jgi:hypothetical protein
MSTSSEVVSSEVEAGETADHAWRTEQTPLGWPVLPRHNQPFTPPAEAHCNIHPHEGVGWVGKEKVNVGLSSVGLRRVRLEPTGASRNPRGHQPAICLLSAAAFSPLPQAGSVGHADW